MTLKELKAFYEFADAEESGIGRTSLALIAIIDELDGIVDHRSFRGEYDKIIARGLEPLK